MQHSSIITKSITLLDMLGSSGRPLTFTDIVKQSEFNKSTVHRLLAILSNEGLVNYNDTNRTYMLGHKLLQLARKAWKGFDLQIIALDEMLRLNSISLENVSVSVLMGNEVMHLKMIESQQHWGIVHPPVFSEPIHTTATGKALTAFMPEKALASWLNQHEFRRSTKRSIVDKKTFEKELEKVRKKGYSVSNREEMDYVVGIAAPIFNFLNEPIAALNIWAPTNRSSAKDLIKWSDEIVNSARIISRLIGSNQQQNKEI